MYPSFMGGFPWLQGVPDDGGSGLRAEAWEFRQGPESSTSLNLGPKAVPPKRYGCHHHGL